MLRTQTRSADDLAQELESQARRLLAVPTAVELASKWVERCDSGQGAYGLGREGSRRGEKGFFSPGDQGLAPWKAAFCYSFCS